MKLTLGHRTTYRFDRPVFLEPHTIRLRPREDATLRLLERTLEIAPAPAVRSDQLDPDSNIVTKTWFEGLTDRLAIESRSTVETLAADPFRFLLDDPERTLPHPYPPRLQDRLAAYLGAADPAPAAVREIAAATADQVARRPERFAWALAVRLQEEITIESRPEGPPHLPATTATTRRGACRDLAVLFMACCRAAGLATRFVSGYAHADGGRENELHAWAEVYLAGGGWRGYDPTLGLAVADRHVALAAAAEPADAAPVTGSYRGDATATLHTLVEVTAT